jgi:hypothetical protein
MNEDEARKYADNLLECQRMVIAKATLAGCSFVPHTRREWSGHKAGKNRDVTYYMASLPDGSCIGVGFRDQYEAACVCVAWLEHTRVPDPTEGTFALSAENEQPKPVMTNSDTTRWPWEKL